ncbi:MAG: hypothetical protein ABR529_15765 [Actinomycetota bacterium]
MELLLVPFLILGQAVPTLLAVVAGIAIARWLGLFEPRGERTRPQSRRGLILALAIVAVVLVIMLIVTPVSTDSGGSITFKS